LGSTEVDQPKGIEVVKQGIQKLKFNQQLKKSEGNKTPKVELTISVDGVAIQVQICSVQRDYRVTQSF
jgi:hypothetical protein